MGQMRFRDPKSEKIKFIADDKGGILIVGKNGEISGKIDAVETPEMETIEVCPEDFRSTPPPQQPPQA